jgi:hypothetical protein
MDTEDENSDPRLEARAKQLFEASVAGLDGSTRSKLARARARAVEVASRPRAITAWLPARSPWLPAGAAAAAAAIAVFVWQGSIVEQSDVGMAAIDDLEILLAEDEFDMFEELEFYAWLDEQPELEMPEPADDGVG